MSHTDRNTRREPAERPFPYVPNAVPVTVQPADITVSVEIEYEDGTVARWSLPAYDPRIDQIEALLGTPGTMRA